MDLLDTSASHQLHALVRGELTALELTQQHLARIGKRDPAIGAFLSVNDEAALAQAEAVDLERAQGAPVGPLAGLPIAIKDNLCDSDHRTTCASKMLEGFRPPYDATVVARLKAEGAVLIGRTNLDEFAMGGSTENSAFQKTHNPRDHQRSPGGSSGGSAACVAAGMAPLAIGSDTGGSIRQPAALCGIVGLKPTYGRVSRYGLVAFASSLDQIGPMGRTVEDVALLLDAISGHDPLDSTSLPLPPTSCHASVNEPLAGLKIGIVPEHFAKGLDGEIDSAVRAAIDVYRSLGAKVIEIDLPHGRFAVATYYVIAPCEASSNLARYDGIHYGYRAYEAAVAQQLVAERKALLAAGDTRGADLLDSNLVRLYRRSRSEAFGPEIKRRIMIGTYALSAGYYDAYYLKALKVRRLIRQDYDAAFEKVDLIAGPCTPTPAFKLGELSSDPLAMYLLDLYTVGANLAGLPAMSLPCGETKSGLPIGLHLTAPALEEDKLLRAARMYENARAN